MLEEWHISLQFSHSVGSFFLCHCYLESLLLKKSCTFHLFKTSFAEIKELESSLKKVPSCRLHFPSTSALHQMELTVTPTEGMYKVIFVQGSTLT